MAALRTRAARFCGMLGRSARDRALADERRDPPGAAHRRIRGQGIAGRRCEARGSARVRWDRPVSEAYRDQRGLPGIDAWAHDLQARRPPPRSGSLVQRRRGDDLGGGHGHRHLRLRHPQRDGASTGAVSPSRRAVDISHARCPWPAARSLVCRLPRLAGAHVGLRRSRRLCRRHDECRCAQGRATERAQGAFVSAQTFDLLGERRSWGGPSVPPPTTPSARPPW